MKKYFKIEVNENDLDTLENAVKIALKNAKTDEESKVCLNALELVYGFVSNR